MSFKHIFYAATVVLAASTSASAQLTIPWWTVDGGGGVSSGGGFVIRGTIGQCDAGRAAAGGFEIAGGFWPTFGIRCVADFDDGSFTGTRDGGVTVDDLLYYLEIYGLGVVAADVDDGTGTNTPDGGVTIEDLLYFLVRFDNGC